MGTVVITGGTDGIGAALARTYLDRGHETLILGTSPEKGKSFLAYAADHGAAGRAHFVPADLSLVAENGRVVELINRSHPAVDVAQILPFLAAPPAPLTAVLEGRRVPTDTAAFDPADAARLHRLTEELLRRHASPS